jgi:hypothetical protein
MAKLIEQIKVSKGMLNQIGQLTRPIVDSIVVGSSMSFREIESFKFNRKEVQDLVIFGYPPTHLLLNS